MGATAALRRTRRLIFPARLVLSGGNLTLELVDGDYVDNPLTGDRLFLSSLPTLAATGLTAGTLYNIYLDTAAGASPRLVPIAASTAFSTTSGIRHRPSTTNQLLIGGAQPKTGPAWVDDEDERLVVSDFNPVDKELLKAGTAESNMTGNNAWLTPPTGDMAVTYIRPLHHAVELHATLFLFHDTAGNDAWGGIDVGATGTPVASSVQGTRRTSGSTEYGSLHCSAFDFPNKTRVTRTSRVRLQGQPNTFDLQGGTNQTNAIFGRIRC